ncbi:hypothetical protein PR048_016219 [Dryococelus australis]|uniref:Uncharacterized protein n=1 Tax=Dryococelus australis TaxID=614101 RepID=A0ABQ9HJE7_9NEOP|nr:hypothetical protein PR048_016219 [Dryococelus australis]
MHWSRRALEPTSSLHWLLHRCEDIPSLTELHVIGAHNCEVFLYWCRVTQGVSHEVRSNDKRITKRFGRLLTSGSREPMMAKRGEYGAAPECYGWGNGRLPIIPADQRNRSARFSLAKIRGRPRWESNQVRLGEREQNATEWTQADTSSGATSCDKRNQFTQECEVSPHNGESRPPRVPWRPLVDKTRRSHAFTHIAYLREQTPGGNEVKDEEYGRRWNNLSYRATHAAHAVKIASPASNDVRQSAPGTFSPASRQSGTSCSTRWRNRERITNQRMSTSMHIKGAAVAERLDCFELNSQPGHSRFSHLGIAPDDAAGRRVFSGISRFPCPFIPTLFHSHLILSSSAHKTSFKCEETADKLYSKCTKANDKDETRGFASPHNFHRRGCQPGTKDSHTAAEQR